MRYIIFKDLYQSRKFIFIYLVIGLIFTFFGVEGGNTAFLGTITLLIVYGTISRNEFNEEKNRGYNLLKTLPIKSYKIVISKFITVFILASGSTLYGLIATRVILNGNVPKIYLYILIGGGELSLILAGVFYYLMYKYGVIKALSFSRIFFFSFIFIPLIINGFFKKLFSNFNSQIIIDIIRGIDGISFGIITFILYLLFMFLSIIQFKKGQVV